MNTVQEIFQRFYLDYLQAYSPHRQQAKAAGSILLCRTSALGAHAYECDSCDHKAIRYNSCRNRHCPSCQGVNRAVWVDQRNSDVLDVPYFHLVCTLPKELQGIVYQNQPLLYNLLYKAVAETVTELSCDPKYLGAQIGFFSVLHTWGKNMHYHPHLHTVVMAGGITKDGMWRNSSKKFFIPVKVLSKKFRGKFLFHLKRYYRENKLQFFKDQAAYLDPAAFRDLVNLCYAKEWYAYVKPPFAGPSAVVAYLGRYTHRIAIANHRILAVDKNSVTISVKGAKGDASPSVSMTGVEFVRRFLMHILPHRFVKIRYYGLLANRNKKSKLSLCRMLTGSGVYSPAFEGLTTTEILSLIVGRDVTQCPACKKGTLTKASTGLPP